MILVTGGCGFIGSHLVDRLCRDRKVVVLDKNPKDFGWPENVKTVKGDIRDSEVVKEVSSDAEVICHLAAHVKVFDSVRNPVPDMKINIGGTLNVLEAAREYGAQVIFASSGAVYGNPQYTPIDEKHPKKPLSPYGISKMAGEHYCRFYTETYGLKTTVLRFSNVYGPRNKKAVIYNFIRNALDERPLRINGDGKQVRDFVYVEDIVQAILLTLKSKKSEIFNIGTGKGISVLKLAEILTSILGKLEIQHKPKLPGDIEKSIMNIEKAVEVLDFTPDYGLEQGIREIIKPEGGRP